MKKISLPLFIFSLIIAFILFSGYGAGPATIIGLSITGAPGENGLMCSNCHGFPGAYGGVSTTVEVFDQGSATLVTNYVSGAIYDVQVTVIHNINTPIGYGFQCVAVNAQGAQVGTFSNPEPNTKIVPLANGVQVAEHNGISVSGQAHIFKWKWTAPTSLLADDVTFYSGGVAVNSNSANTGDSGSSLSGTLTLPPSSFPVELIDFSGTNIDNKYHLLEWSTASEQDADYFLLEHSTDEESFVPIADISATGNTTEQQDYSFRYTQPKQGINYYRLSQIDFDGKKHVFNTISIKLDEVAELVSVYPVPAFHKVNLEIRYPEDGAFQLKLMDYSGKTLRSQDIMLIAGMNTIELDLSDLPAGTYLAHISNGETQISSSLIKF